MGRTTLDDMKRNPAGWRIQDVETICRLHGATCSPPRGGGSHYKISKPGKVEILTVPSNGQLSQYIKKLAAFLRD